MESDNSPEPSRRESNNRYSVILQPLRKTRINRPERPKSVYQPKPKQVEFSGALTKEGYYRQSWKLRHFILKENTLYYFKNHLEKEAIGEILLDKDTVVVPDGTKDKPFCFKIEHKLRRTFYLCAKDEGELKIWVDVLRTSIKQQLQAQTEIQSMVIFLLDRTLSYLVSIAANTLNDTIPSSPLSSSDGLLSTSPRSRERSRMLSNKEINAIQQMATDLKVLKFKSDSGSFLRHSMPEMPKTESPWKSAVVPIKDVVLLCDVGMTIAMELVKLLTHKYSVRILVRRGILSETEIRELRDFDLDVTVVDYSSHVITEYFKNVKKIFLFQDLSNVESIVQDTANILEAGVKNNCQYIIKSSFVGTEKWHRYTDTLITKSGIPYTLLHCNCLMQYFLIEGIKNTSLFSMPIPPNINVSWLDVRDLLQAVGKILLSPSGFQNKTFLITGPESLNAKDMSTHLSKVTLNPVSYQEINQKLARKHMSESADMNEAVIESHGLMWKSIVDGQNSNVSGDLVTIIGNAGHSFAQFCNDHADVFREEYLKYFPKDSEELYSLYKQFDRMNNLNKKTKKSILYDGSIDRDAFVTSMGLILGDRDLAESLYKGFKSNTMSQRLSFSEYAAGVGRLLKGSMEDRLEIGFRMYEEGDFLSERGFVQMSDTIHRFALNAKLDSEKKQFLTEYFYTIAEQRGVTRKMYRLSLDTLKQMNDTCQQMMGLIVKEDGFKRKMQKLAISFGHENWDLAENMLMGIRHCMKRFLDEQALMVNDDSFEAVQEYSIYREGGPFLFTDYAPGVFFKLRKMYGIESEEYMASLAPSQLLGSLEEVVSTGRSGSYIYRSSDKKYLLKTIPNEEVAQLRKVLKDYYHHLKHNENSFLTRFFGLHRISFQKHEHHFVVMRSVLYGEIDISEQYDLKGSTIGRVVEMAEGQEPDPNVALKDLNFNRKLCLNKDKRKLFLSQIDKDTKWMEERNICDYSLLVGIALMSPLMDLPPNHSSENVSVWTKEYGGIVARTRSGEELKEVYFIGLIDILTAYDLKKKSELAIKTILHPQQDASSISAQPPGPYRGKRNACQFKCDT